MIDIKPIETIYKGYRFRSRLEARWAVFFDACGIPYQYEPDGFYLKARQYLPDFYLPWWKCYVEIKPNEPEKINEGRQCCEDLFNGKDGIITMLCIGDPMDDNIRVFCNEATDSSGGGPNEWKVRFLEGGVWEDHGFTKHWIGIITDPTRSDRTFFTRDWAPAEVTNGAGMIGFRSDFEDAKTKARQARFEHGETPRI